MVTVSPVVSVDGAQEGVTLAEETAKNMNIHLELAQ